MWGFMFGLVIWSHIGGFVFEFKGSALIIRVRVLKAGLPLRFNKNSAQ